MEKQNRKIFPRIPQKTGWLSRRAGSLWFEGAIASGKFGGKKKSVQNCGGTVEGENIPPQVGALIINKLQPFVEGGGKLMIFLNFPHKQG